MWGSIYKREITKRLLIQGTNNPSENSNKATQGYMYRIQNDSIHFINVYRLKTQEPNTKQWVWIIINGTQSFICKGNNKNLREKKANITVMDTLYDRYTFLHNEDTTRNSLRTMNNTWKDKWGTLSLQQRGTKARTLTYDSKIHEDQPSLKSSDHLPQDQNNTKIHYQYIESRKKWLN